MYSASLQQFEELLAAAEHVGPASKPLLLFYALSQGGRAMVAAHRRGNYVVNGHGLRQVHAATHNPLALAVRVVPRSDGLDAFSAVSEVAGIESFPSSVDVGAAWAAIPGTHRIPDPAWHESWRPAHMFDLRSRPDGRLGGRILGIGGNPHLGFDQVLSDLRVAYPSLPSETRAAMLEASRDFGSSGSWMADIEWSSDVAAADDVVPEGHGGHRWLLPALPDGDRNPPDVLLWWIVLFGLSVVARYEPAAWSRALDVERSELAVPLEALLVRAQEAIPEQIHYEMFRSREPQA